MSRFGNRKPPVSKCRTWEDASKPLLYLYASFDEELGTMLLHVATECWRLFFYRCVPFCVAHVPVLLLVCWLGWTMLSCRANCSAIICWRFILVVAASVSLFWLRPPAKPRRSILCHSIKQFSFGAIERFQFWELILLRLPSPKR